jgi:hypothetical protein
MYKINTIPDQKNATKLRPKGRPYIMMLRWLLVYDENAETPPSVESLYDKEKKSAAIIYVSVFK